MRSLGAEAAVSAELRSSARRTERSGTRREPCMLNDRSSAGVGLEPEGIGADPDARAVRAGSTAREWTDPQMRGQETLAGHGIVVARASSTAMDQTTFVVGAPELKAGSPAACTASSVRRRRGVTILSLF